MPPVHVRASRVVEYNAFGTESTEELLARAEEWRRLGHVLWTEHNGGHCGFENAGTVDFDRKVNYHLTFSVGPHKCIGSAMARVVMAAALDEFHEAIESYRLVSASSHLGGVWGMHEVNLAW